MSILPGLAKLRNQAKPPQFTMPSLPPISNSGRNKSVKNSKQHQYELQQKQQQLLQQQQLLRHQKQHLEQQQQRYERQQPQQYVTLDVFNKMREKIYEQLSQLQSSINQIAKNGVAKKNSNKNRNKKNNQRTQKMYRPQTPAFTLNKLLENRSKTRLPSRHVWIDNGQ